MRRHRINPLVIKDLSREPFTLQDKRLLGVDYTEIAILSVKTREKHTCRSMRMASGSSKINRLRKLSQQAADLLVSRVANLPAEERVTRKPPRRPPTGSCPTAEFVATGRDGKIAGRLTLGSQAGNLIYATGERLQGVFQARPDLLNQIPAKAELLAKPAGKTQRLTSTGRDFN